MVRAIPMWGLGCALASCSQGATTVCTPGASRACACSDAGSGVQACNDAGTDYAACVCTAGDASASDATDASGDVVTVDTPDAQDVSPCGTYNAVVLGDHPVAFWNVDRGTGSEPDLTGNGNNGSYHGAPLLAVTMPNGDAARDFDGASQYVSVPSNRSFSIPTTGSLTWEGWIRPDVLQYPHDNGGYIDWMGKCANYSPTCEWEARMYDTTNPQGRCNRFSAYAFNPSAGLGSGADWQPMCGLITAGHWYHVVGAYTTLSMPADCPNAPMYPGSLNIWVNGVPWNQASHTPTGCMSQYNVVPVANGSTLDIGTMAMDSWFAGAIGKVAIYDHVLTQAQISAHYCAMTGQAPAGHCAATCTFM